MSGVCYSEMQFVRGRLQGRYRAKRAVNETVPAPFPAAAAWGRPVKTVPPLLGVVVHDALYSILYSTVSRPTQVPVMEYTVEKSVHVKV